MLATMTVLTTDYSHEYCASRCGKMYPLKLFAVFSGVYVLIHPRVQY